MARPLRIQYPGAVYHVMNRGGSRQRVFLDKQDCEGFLKTIGEVCDRWAVEVFAYCVMGNHYHVCLCTPEGNLSRVMQHLDGLYTQRFNRLHRRDGALFRGRYKAIIVLPVESWTANGKSLFGTQQSIDKHTPAQIHRSSVR
jgi:REP element-mobilizing transposase RayT